MNRKTASGIMLILHLTYVLTLTLNFKVAIAESQTSVECIWVHKLQSVSSIALDENLVWFGTIGNGVFRYNETDDSWSMYNTENSGIAGNYVASVAVDGNFIWFGTQNQYGTPGRKGDGVSRYDKTTGTWTTFNPDNSGIAGSNVKSIVVDGEVIWFGISRGGISRYNKADNTWTTYNSSNSGLVNDLVISLAIDGDEVWAGTNGQYTTNDGLSRFNQTSGNWTTYTGNGLDYVTEIAVDSDLIWFARYESDGGGTKYNKTRDTWTFYNSFREAESVAVDNNSILFGTRSGVFEYSKENNTWTTFNKSNSGLVTDWINAITVDGRHVWFSCYPVGVVRYDKVNGDWVCWSSDDTPPSITILSPQNTTNTIDSIPLIFTVSESTSWEGYSLDNQPNVTIVDNATLVGLDDGSHSIVVYANDTCGNMGASDRVHFTVGCPPTIENISRAPVTPNYDLYVVVSATITDNVNVSQALLSYTQDLTWHNVSMNRFGNLCNATIPAQPYGTLVHYRIYANDTVDNWAVSDLYSYNVEDFVAPEVSLSKTPVCPLTGDPVMVYANVTEPVDASGADTVLFSYRVNNGSWWNTTMSYNETHGLFEITISDQQRNDTVEYLVEATDNAGNTNTTDIHYYIVASADINGDGIVDIYDLNIAGKAYGSFAGEPRYRPEADINSDGHVDMRDIVVIARNYGKTDT